MSSMKRLTKVLDYDEKGNSILNPKEAFFFLKIQSKISLREAIESNGSLQILEKESPTELKQSITNLIFMLNESLNLSVKINEFQAMEMTFYIISEYPYLKLEELILIFKKGKTGSYGQENNNSKIYNRVDISVINTWILHHLNSEERWCIIEENYQKEKDKFRTRPKDWNPENRKMIDAIFEKAIVQSQIKKQQEKDALNEKRYNDRIERIRQTVKIVTDEDLQTYLKEYTDDSFKEAIEIVNEEIILRKLNALVIKIKSGNNDFTPEELQFQKNHSSQLEVILKQNSK